MPRKGMRSIFFSSSWTSSPTHSNYSHTSSSPLGGSSSTASSSHYRGTLSSSMIEENVEIAESIISKWNIDDGSSKIDYLFAGGDRREAKEFLRSVKNLQSAMHFFMSEEYNSDLLVHAQNLMQIAMKRLEKEFYRILSTNRTYSDPESVSTRSSRDSKFSLNTSDFEDYGSEDEINVDSFSELAIEDLKVIADSMISFGYGKECMKIYKLVRKSVVEEGLYFLGVERLSSSQIQKMDWEVIEHKIKTWIESVKIAFNTIFLGERILCDQVFSASATSARMADSCLLEITHETAMTLFRFPETVAKHKKLSLEKIFILLDLYEAISELWPEIDFVFSCDWTSTVKSQAITSLVKLGEAIRSMLTEFEAAIQKEASKSPVHGAGVHPLARYVMNYVVFLSDYSGILSDIVADWPLPMQSPLPESYLSSPNSDESPAPAISVRFAWLVLVLLCKLDVKAELYKDVSLSYLFLANNLNYVVSKVRSSNLRALFGEDWLQTHENKVRQYAANYERMGWSRVTSSLPESNPMVRISPEVARECFGSFNSAFEEANRKQSSLVISDLKLRDEIRVSVLKKIAPAYRIFYEKYRAMFRRESGVESLVRYAPDDVANYLGDLFSGSRDSSVSSSSFLSSSNSPERRVR